MTTQVTKTWFVDGKIIEQVIPESEIYKRDWTELTDADRKSYQAGHNAGVKHQKQITKREWVGLTDEEREECVGEYYRGSIAAAIEAKLKEKNA